MSITDVQRRAIKKYRTGKGLELVRTLGRKQYDCSSKKEFARLRQIIAEEIFT